MSEIILRDAVVVDDWQILRPGADESLSFQRDASSCLCACGWTEARGLERAAKYRRLAER